MQQTQQVLTIPVSSGNEISCLVQWPQLKPGMDKPLGYILNCKGVGWDLRKESSGKRSIFNKVMWQIENVLVEQGFAIAYVSPTGYIDDNKSHRSALSLDSHINDIADVVNHLEAVFGERLNTIGHSLGAYIVARLALFQQKYQRHVFSSVALLSPLFSLREPVEKVASIYTQSHELRRRALATAIVAGANLWTMAGYCSFVAGLQNGSGSASALVDDVLAAPAIDELVKGSNGEGFRTKQAPVLIIYGRKDLMLFPQAGLSFAEKQTWQDFEARWKAIAPEAEIIGYENLGHNFSTGLTQLLATALPRYTQLKQVREIADAVAKHFKVAYAPVK